MRTGLLRAGRVALARVRSSFGRGRALGLAVVVTVSTVDAAFGQEDSVTVRAGTHYAAGPLGRLLLGSDHRDLWTAPIRVPILSPDTFAGGLTPLERGGGRQTVSLRLGDRHGREYVFRSVDKEQGLGLHPDLHGTLVSHIVQDQVSSKHPGAAMVVAPLMDAVGVLHATPRLAVLADHPGLGEYRQEFAGLFGMIEERPTETDGAGPFGRFERIIGTDRLYERLEESSVDRVDSRAYLTARLMDLFLGDWDRHEDQWRWAQSDRDGRRYWLPIPRDRDNAFSSVDGLIGIVGGAIRPFVLPFEHEITGIEGLTYNGRRLDRLVLSELPPEVWDSIAGSIQTRLTDEVIAAAVRRQPPEYYGINGPLLEEKLRARRDGLTGAAREFHSLLSGAVDIRGTDEDDRLVVQQAGDGTVEVTITAEAGEYYRRAFAPAETREIRVDLRGGADSATVRGVGPSRPLIRVLGGGGEDHLADETLSGGRVIFYDEDDDTEMVTTSSTIVDRRRFELPVADTLTQNNQPPLRDWGSDASMFVPGGRWISEIGPVLTVGPVWTRYGFRRFPYARRTSVSVEVGPFDARFGIAAVYHAIRTGGDGELRLAAGATQIDLTRFYGFGNEPFAAVVEDNRFWSNRYWGRVEVTEVLSPRARVTFGPEVVHIDPDPDFSGGGGSSSAPGLRAFTLGGIRGAGEFDGRDSEAYPTDGARVQASVEWFPLTAGDAPEAFARNTVVATAYHRLPLPLESTLALRGGGEAVWGTPPIQYAPAVGGSGTVRGFQTDRFRGDASLHGSAELRNRIGNINLLISRGDLGTIVVADAGRVFGEGSAFAAGRWHYGFGGGLWFGPVDRKYVAHVVAVQGAGVRYSAGLGMPF